MDIFALIIVVKILIWIIVAFRHINKELFYFFLVLACIDPTFFLVKSVITLTSNMLYVPLNLLLYLTLKPGIKALIMLSAIIGTMYYVEFSSMTINISIMIMHFFIAAQFIKFAIEEINNSLSISLFYPVLFFFAVMTIVKAWFYTFDISTGLTHFFFFNSIQMILGIFFIFFTKEKFPGISFTKLFE